MAIVTRRWTPDTCQCQLSYQYDTGLADADKVFTLGAFARACPEHSSLSGVTGNFEDTDHAVDVVPTDNINHIMDASASAAGSIAVHYIGFMAEPPVPAAPEGHQPSSVDWAQFQTVEVLAY